MTVKASTTDMCDLSPIRVQEEAVMKHAFLRLPHRKCMGNLWLAVNLYKTFDQKDFEIFLVGQRVLQMSQISRSCVIVLNIFEDSAQRIHIIPSGNSKTHRDIAIHLYICDNFTTGELMNPLIMIYTIWNDLQANQSTNLICIACIPKWWSSIDPLHARCYHKQLECNHVYCQLVVIIGKSVVNIKCLG